MTDPNAETHIWPEGETAQNENLPAQAWADEQLERNHPALPPVHGKVIWTALVVILVVLSLLVLWGFWTLISVHSSNIATTSGETPGTTLVPPSQIPQSTTPLAPPPLATVTVSPPTVTVTPPLLPTGPSRDARYLALMADKGIGPADGDPHTLINEAHVVCNRVAQGEPENFIVQDVRLGSSPPLSLAQSQFLTATAINLYCPVGS